MNIQKLKQIEEISKKLGLQEIQSNINKIINIVEEKGVKPVIINTGLLKAGKSSLFNALCDKEKFKSGVIRTTTVNKKFELPDYVLVDTPGLNANEEDTNEAFEEYKNADVIIFVHNIEDGELSRVECDAIHEISSIFQGTDGFLNSSILVLSHADQVEEATINKIKSVIQNQCEKIFEGQFAHIISVNSIGYLRGVSEEKQLLVKTSNVLCLKEILIKEVNKEKKQTYFKQSVKKSLEKVMGKVTIELQGAQERKVEIDSIVNQIYAMEKVKKEILGKVKYTINGLQDEKVVRSNFLTPYFSYEDSSYCKNYDSKYRAKEEAQKACEKAIKNAASAARERALGLVADYQNYIAPDGKINSVKMELYKTYNELKEIYYSVIKNAANIPVLELSLKKDGEIDRLKSGVEEAYRRAKIIRQDFFHSAKHYLTNYSSNMWIEESTTYKEVKGIFGGTKYKDVNCYNWEIKGAIDDVKSHAKEMVEDVEIYAYDEVNELYKCYIADFISQFNDVYPFFKKQIDHQIAQMKKCVTDSEMLEERITSLKIINKELECVYI